MFRRNIRSCNGRQVVNFKLSAAGFPKTAMTIGIFDGVHRGHQALIKRVVSHNASVSSDSLIPVIITFRENEELRANGVLSELPSHKHKNSMTLGNIQSFQERLEIFEQLGAEITLVIDFTESFRRIRGIEFLETLNKHGNIGFFAVGSGFRCGYQLDTDAAAIRDYFVSRNIQVEIVPEVMEGTLPISSSRIRAAIANGDLLLAQSMLGEAVSVKKLMYNPNNPS